MTQIQSGESLSVIASIIGSSAERDAWLDARRNGVTATDVARLIRGGTGTWAAIRAEKAGRGREFKSTAMQHGLDRERVILAYAERVLGLAPSGDLYSNNEYPSRLATPDSISETAVGEIKTTVHDWPTLADAPAPYIDQILWQMLVTGRRIGYLIFEPHEDYVPLYPDPRVFIVEWNPDRVEQLIAVAEEFMAGEGEPDENAAQLDLLLIARAKAKEISDAASARVVEFESRIREVVKGKPTRFEGSFANLTLSADGTSDRFDSPAFKKAQPDMYQQFVKAVPTKGRLTITERKESA